MVYASHSKDSKVCPALQSLQLLPASHPDPEPLRHQQLIPEQFLVAISRPLFIAYSVTSLVAISILAYLSQTRYGDRFVLIDLALCALAGAFSLHWPP